MKQATVNQLLMLNRVMYTEAAAVFSQTRQRPWPGWDPIVNLLMAGKPRRSLTVLDVGCGNGRFGDYLTRRFGPGVNYLGIDQAETLLTTAQTLLNGRLKARFLTADITQNELSVLTEGSQFDLVACFGVMHHLPRQKDRLRWLAQMLAAVKKGGLLAVSFWRPLQLDRFKSRLISWDEVGVAAADLEPGDVLLPFGPDKQPRYCHHFETPEVDGYIDQLNAPVAANYLADGNNADLNRYVIWQSTDEE